MVYFTAHTFNCVCHCIRVMFRVLGMYNFGRWVDTTINYIQSNKPLQKKQTLLQGDFSTHFYRTAGLI